MKFKILIILFIISISAFSQNVENVENVENFFRAENYYLNNKTDSAVNELRKNLSEVNSTVFLSKIYLKQSKTNDAIATLQNSFKENNDKKIALELSKIYAGLAFEDEAIFWLEQYFNNNKNPLFYSQIIINQEFNNINNTQLWKDFWNTNPYPKNYSDYENIDYLIHSTKYDEALQTLNLISDNQYSYLKNYYLALIDYKSSDYKEAYNYINLSVQKNQNFLSAQKLKFQIEKELKKYETAKKTAIFLLKKDSFCAENYYEKAEIQYLLKNYDESYESINYFLNFFQSDKKALLLKSKVEIALGNKTDALITLNTILLDKSLNYESHLLRANILYEYGMWDIAKNDFSMALDVEPKNGETYYKYGMCWLNLNMTEKACYNLKKAVQLRFKKAQNPYFKNCE